MTFTLMKLPFEKDALQPYISEETLEYHYGKHHQAYVNKLNGLLKGTPQQDMSLNDIIKISTGSVFNNAAQVFNHDFYWQCLSAQHDMPIPDNLVSAINASFESIDKFKELFTQTAITTFGSGWIWLVITPENTLEIRSTSNAENPITAGEIPILTCDVWEHAYYIDTRNNRGQYIDHFWHLVNWTFVNQRLK